MKRTVEQIETEWLVLRCQSGDLDALSELIGKWQPKLSRYVYRLTKGHEDSADLLQEIWMVVARKLRRLEDPAAFPHWLYRIATARCSDWIRKRKRDRQLKQDVDAQNSAGSDASADSTDAHAALRHAIGKLPTDQRVVLTMFYLDDLSVAQIATALDIPHGTVKSRLYHARNALRTLVERSES